ncbi:hypothetical protein N9Z36_08860 [Luminiphilus sp.]|nr:hypothetical protein [Luminiphilus sp.]
MISQALGLLLTGTLLGLVSGVYRNAMVSEDAAQTAARAYFLIDTISHWISQTEGLMGQPASDQPFSDPCETPQRMPMSLARPGIVLINAATVPCVGLEGVGLEGVGLETTKIPLTALLLDRRWICNGQCKGPGFYAFIPACSSLEPTVLWRASPVPPEGCVGGDTVYQIQRSIIYSRPYSWRVDDGLPAIMLREQATEPDARWLRSSMLAPEIVDWQIDCVAGCAQDSQRASPLWGYKLRFSAQGRHLSQLVERTVALSAKFHE